MQELQNYVPLIISSLGAFFAGGWFVWRRKKGAVTAELANREFTDISSMVATYTTRLAELSNDITDLHAELTDVKQKQSELEEENKQLHEENAALRKRIKRLENEQNN